MKKSIIIITYTIIIINLILQHGYTENRIAVIKSKYDNIELVLDTYHIHYDLLDYKSLGDKETYNKYDSIFFPSGIASEYESNINVNWEGKDITSVNLSKNFFELHEKEFRDNLRKFTQEGGSSYFSGYAVKQLMLAYNDFNFFENFPYMGIPCRIEADLNGDLARFSLSNKAALYMDYVGWVALKSVDGAEIISEGKFPTPKGEKSGPISALIRDGSGEILYTSYYSTVYSEFKRFNIYRISGSILLKKTIKIAQDHLQDVTGMVVDAFLNGEASRSYYFDLKKGNNTIYILSEYEPFMYEIYDSNLSVIVAKDLYETSQSYNIVSHIDSYCIVKVYPSTRERFSMHSIISATGTAIPPKVAAAVRIIAAGFGLILLAAFLKVLISRLK